MSTLPPATTLHRLPTDHLTRLLDLLFEPSLPLHALALPLLTSTSFPTYPALIAAIHAQLSALAASDNPDHLDTLSTILCSHPRLGEKHVESEQSRAEQAQLHTGHDHDEAQLHALNIEYEQKFPGLRYVVFVNGRPRPVIMENMRARIDRGLVEAERQEAIQAMCDIAADRAAKLHR